MILHDLLLVLQVQGRCLFCAVYHYICIQVIFINVTVEEVKVIRSSFMVDLWRTAGEVGNLMLGKSQFQCFCMFLFHFIWQFLVCICMKDWEVQMEFSGIFLIQFWTCFPTFFYGLKCWFWYRWRTILGNINGMFPKMITFGQWMSQNNHNA